MCREARFVFRSTSHGNDNIRSGAGDQQNPGSLVIEVIYFTPTHFYQSLRLLLVYVAVHCT